MDDARAVLAGSVEIPARGRGPGVLVWLGPEVSGEAGADARRRLAQHGFVAWTPEGSGEASDPPSDRAMAGKTAERLLRLDAVDGARVGVLGIGSGARRALAAAESPRVAAALCLEPTVGPEDAAPECVEARVLLVRAEKDGSADALADLRDALQAAGGRAELRELAGVEPGCLDPIQADRYDAAAARVAWDACLAVLRAEL